MKLEFNLWHFNFYDNNLLIEKREWTISTTHCFGFSVPILCFRTEEVSISDSKCPLFGSDYIKDCV